MNIKDIETALDFMGGCDYKYIVLQCRSKEEIPYIRRALRHLWGEPSWMIDDSFYYGKKRIVILPLSKTEDMKEFAHEQCFYVAWKDNKDWIEYDMERLWLCDVMMTDTFTLADVYNLLVREGHTGQQALDIISNEYIMKV